MARLDYAVADRAGARTPVSAEVTIIGVNDAPEFVGPPTAHVETENATAVASLAARDAGAGDARAHSIEGGGANDDRDDHRRRRR